MSLFRAPSSAISSVMLMVSIIHRCPLFFLFFFFNDTATTEIYTLSLHDALPILERRRAQAAEAAAQSRSRAPARRFRYGLRRSEEYTSELQSLTNLVCRLLLEKKKQKP